MRFSYPLCVIFLCAVHLSVCSYCRGSILCAIFLCSSFICSTSLYNYVFVRIVVICFTCGKVLMHSFSWCVFSCVLLILSSNYFSFGFIVSSVQMCVLSLHILMHSYSNILIFSTNVCFVLSLCSLSSGGVPGTMHTSSSVIFVLSPLMTSPIFDTCSSIMASTTIGTSGTSFYNFWTANSIFYTIFSTLSFSFKVFSSFSSTSLFSLTTISTFFSTAHFYLPPL
jgi:hypothetical protein